MGCPRPACPECTRKCSLIHGKNKDPSPVVKSFFKIMFGDNFSEVLFLPPKVSRMMLDLVGKETQLEDASGQRWKVTISRHDRFLVFQQGWPSFFLEHALEVGDLVTFHYILGSHFVVQIYGRNGCERLHFSEENASRKKRKTDTPSSAKDGKYCPIDSNSMNEQGQVTSALSGSNMEIVTDNALNIDNGSPRKLLNEEQLCMLGMDDRHRHEDHGNSLYDLPYFEMQRTCDVDGITRVLEHERSPCHGNRMSTSQAGADIVDRITVTEKVVAPYVPNLQVPEVSHGNRMSTSQPGADIVDGIPATEKVVAPDVPNLQVPEVNHGNRMSTSQAGADIVDRISATENVIAPDVPNVQVHEAEEDFQMIDKVGLVSTKDSGDGNTIGQEQRKKTKSREKMEEAKTKKMEMKTEIGGVRDVINAKYPEPKECGYSFKAKEEAKTKKMEMKTEVCGVRDVVNGKYPEPKECGYSVKAEEEDHIFKAVKTEPVDTFEWPSAVSGTISLMVTEMKPFLELPRVLPGLKFKAARTNEEDRHRRAAVLLRDLGSRLWPVIYHERSGIKVLTSGWEAFARANSIQPGDEYSFELEDKREWIYKVGIVRKEDSQEVVVIDIEGEVTRKDW